MANFSDYFDVEPSILASYGAFNISLICDLPLFIDPFLLFNSKKDVYKALHKNILTYVEFLRTMAVEGEQNTGDLKNWYYFSEVKQNWFGYCQYGNEGHGLGKKFGEALNRNLFTLFNNFGKEKVTSDSHLEKLCLIKDGVGRDNISDFTTNLIKEYLLDYTQKFAKEFIAPSKRRSVAVDKVRFNYSTTSWESDTFDLPFFEDDYVLLTPKDILTKDNTWINRDELDREYWTVINSIDNDQLRAQLSQYFKRSIPKNATAKDVHKVVGNALEVFPSLIDYYIKYKEDNADGARLNSEKRISFSNTIYVEKVGEVRAFLSKNTEFYNIVPNSYEEAMSRVLFFKRFVEVHDGYRVFYNKTKPIKREEDLQLMYRLTWFGSDYSVDREVNNGRGPVDYKISKGALDSSIVEFKLAKNSHLKDMLKQVKVYEEANDLEASIKVIIFFSESEREKVNKLIKAFGLKESKSIVLIDATPNKLSASKIR